MSALCCHQPPPRLLDLWGPTTHMRYAQHCRAQLSCADHHHADCLPCRTGSPRPAPMCRTAARADDEPDADDLALFICAGSSAPTTPSSAPLAPPRTLPRASLTRWTTPTFSACQSGGAPRRGPCRWAGPAGQRAGLWLLVAAAAVGAHPLPALLRRPTNVPHSSRSFSTHLTHTCAILHPASPPARPAALLPACPPARLPACLQVATLLDAKEVNKQYVFSYTLAKEGEAQRTVYSALAMGNNGRWVPACLLLACLSCLPARLLVCLPAFLPATSRVWLVCWWQGHRPTVHATRRLPSCLPACLHAGTTGCTPSTPPVPPLTWHSTVPCWSAWSAASSPPRCLPKVVAVQLAVAICPGCRCRGPSRFTQGERNEKRNTLEMKKPNPWI